MKSKAMFKVNLPFLAILLTGVLVLNGCGGDIETEKGKDVASETQNNNTVATQEDSQINRGVYAPASRQNQAYPVGNDQTVRGYPSQYQSAQMPQQYRSNGVNYNQMPGNSSGQNRNGSIYFQYGSVPARTNKAGNPWTQSTGPRGGADNGMRYQVPGGYPPAGNQTPHQYRPLESSESNQTDQASSQRYRPNIAPPVQQYNYPPNTRAATPYPGTGYSGYAPYSNGYGLPNPGNIGIPSIGVPGVW